MNAQQEPKYKTIGLITAHAATGTPTAAVGKFTIAWVTGLKFRNNVATEALCVTPSNHDPRHDGLHLAPDAARQLVTELRSQAAIGPAVDVDNHDQHEINVWKRFSAEDAVAIANLISVAVVGH